MTDEEVDPDTGENNATADVNDRDDSDVTVEAVQFSDRAKAEAFGAPLTPQVVDYDPAPEREKMRNWISKGVLLAAGLAGLGAIVNGAVGGHNEQAVGAVFTGLVGLAGTVIGFYFGGKDRTG